jgi:predicted lipid-binding transport protein (Tim44 family)
MGGFGHFIGAIVGAVFGFFIFLVIVGLLFLLVRFLLASTRAAHIYIAKNSPAAAPRAAAPSGSAGTTYAPHTTTVAPTPPAGKPATIPRTPKPPAA